MKKPQSLSQEIEQKRAKQNLLKTSQEQLNISLINQTNLDTCLQNTLQKRFIKNDKGIIKDTTTNAEWYVKNEYVTWDSAKKWIDELNQNKFDGGNWQMPRMEQLQRLYEKGKGNCNINSIFSNETFLWAWTNELTDENNNFICRLLYQDNIAKLLTKEREFYDKNTKYLYARCFDFSNGGDSKNCLCDDLDLRIFSVRVSL